MNTTLTSGQLQNFFTLLEQKQLTPERFQLLLESGLLADLLGYDLATMDVAGLRKSWQVAAEICRRDPPSQPLPPSVEPLPLLKPPGTITLPATNGQFRAKDWFVLNHQANGLPRIVKFWDNFQTWFLAGTGKQEEALASVTLSYWELTREATDAEILLALGGEKLAETSLTEIFGLLQLQKNGEDGVLLVNGWANIFYIRDQTGVLRAVDVRWRGDGWYVNAYPVEDPYRWEAGYRVFSRQSGQVLAA